MSPEKSISQPHGSVREEVYAQLGPWWSHKHLPTAAPLRSALGVWLLRVQVHGLSQWCLAGDGCAGGTGARLRLLPSLVGS